MPTTVQPSAFTMVDFDAGEIAALSDRLATELGLGEVAITIEVDETTPLGRTELVSIDPVHIRTESGSLEDPKRIRQFCEQTATDVLGRYLLRAHDRRDGGFADAPSDSELSVPNRTAWEVYAVGRLARAGHPVRRQRWLYAFRNRHGFTDQADAAFEKLWHAEGTTWEELSALSDETASANPGPLER